MKTPVAIHEVDKIPNTLAEDLEVIQTKVKNNEITGYALVTISKGGIFSVAFICKSRLELLGALQMATYDVSKDA